MLCLDLTSIVLTFTRAPFADSLPVLRVIASVDFANDSPSNMKDSEFLLPEQL